MNSKPHRKIFLVDDDPFCKAMYEEHLINLGFSSVVSFSSAKELLANLYQNPDLVFLDYNLEDIKGIELLHNIKAFNNRINVVVISGQSDMNVAIQFLKSGAFDYVIKDGNDTDKISLVIEKWLKAVNFNANVKENVEAGDEKQLKAIIEAQEQIRKEISIELNDKVNQLLSVSRLYMETAYVDEENRLSLITDSKTAISSAMIEIRKLIQSLNFPKVINNNLEEEIPRIITMLQMMDRFTVLSNLNIKGINNVISAGTQQRIIVILQALTKNIIKFSNATKILIGITLCENDIHFLLTDDGIGFDLQQSNAQLGLPKIYSQISELNGVYEINTAPGKGCRWNLRFPLDRRGI